MAVVAVASSQAAALSPAVAPRVLLPGVMSLGNGVERYRVVGGGATVLGLHAGDELEVVDPQGCQQCEVVAFDSGGVCVPDLLAPIDALSSRRASDNTPSDGPSASEAGLSGRAATDAAAARPVPSHSTGTRDAALRGRAAIASAGDAAAVSVLSAPVVDARRMRAGLARQGITRASLQGAAARRLLEPDHGPGARACLVAHEEATVAVVAPGSPMEAHRQDPPTDLIVFVHRGNPPQRGAPPLLPVPLADPTQEFIVDRSTAATYEVAKGDFFQVIDVEGRQCSDFQCFAVADLDAGLELCLDATVTRTLMGAACPTPGLYSKFYNARMRPLAEVIQDTVGRHDTFNTACSARYYEEMGYPGHVNCTDNINQQLAPYGVASRRGWEAINFYYNTNLDAAHQIYLDEPWSRPGDYVLLRALEDLVCVSTSCPDDIDAANGWNPTDIAVRVYPSANLFKKATAFRMTTDSEAELTKETGFHPRTSQLTRSFGEYNGYWLADSYTAHGATEEYWACRQAAAAIDLSPLRKYEVTGPDAELLLQTCLTRNIRKLAVGAVVYTAMCHDTGGMIDDGTVFRLGQHNFRWIGGSDHSGLWLREQAEARGLRAWVRRSTEQLHNLQVQGPNSRRILQQVVWTRPDQPTMAEMGWFRFAVARLGGPDGAALVVSRTGYTGELGYEVFCHPNDAPQVWDAFFEAGATEGLKPMGLAALDMLRIEAGLVFAGAEFCDQTDPYEAGIGFTVALKTKPDDFIGRQALEARRDNPQRRLVGLELVGNEPASHGDGVYVGRLQVGVITSATISPILQSNIALCRMAVQHAEAGTEVQVGKLDGHQKRLEAKVVPFPFYDPEKKRVRDLP